MKNKKIIYILAIVIIVAIIVIISILKINKKNSNANTQITVDSTNIIEIRNYDWTSLNTKEKYETGYVKITSGGSYTLTNNLTGVYIDTKEAVELILDNVTIESSDGPSIMIENSKITKITIKEGTINNISDSKTYNDTLVEDEVNGCIFSKDNLVITGSGTLNITSNYEDAIVGKDNLLIENGTLNITSSDDAIRGKDSLVIDGGNFTINSTGDGLKSSDTENGYIEINGGTFDINSTLDAIQSETNLIINNGNFNIITGGGSNITSSNQTWGSWGREQQNKNTTTESAKAIKAVKDIKIVNGTFIINSSDDAIHSNGNIVIDSGTFEIQSGYDGIHADSSLTINNGNININKSYEGIESSTITINGGNISITASDDGINVAGGVDQSSQQNRPGQNNYSTTSNTKLTINKGTIYVNSTGDGIDVNGSAYINGGTITVDGPTNDGNGPLDYDGIFEVNGGTLLAGGSSGMAQSISNSSKQVGLIIIFNSTINSSSTIEIKNDNNVIETYKCTKNIKSLLITGEKLSIGKTYSIYVNGTLYSSITLSSTTNQLGNSNNGMGGMRR